MNNDPNPIIIPPVAPAAAPANKKWLVKGLALLGAALIAVAIFTVASVISSVKKADYEKALSVTKELRLQYDTVQSSAMAYKHQALNSSVTQADFDKAKTDYETAYSAYTKKINQLSTMAALRDGDIKWKYDRFVKVQAEFDTRAKKTAESLPLLRGVFLACKSVVTTAELLNKKPQEILAAYDTTTIPCSNAAKKLSGAPEPNMAAAGTALVDIYAKERDLMVLAEQGLLAGNTAKVAQARDGLADLYTDDRFRKSYTDSTDWWFNTLNPSIALGAVGTALALKVAN